MFSRLAGELTVEGFLMIPCFLFIDSIFIWISSVHVDMFILWSIYVTNEGILSNLETSHIITTSFVL